MSLRCKSDIRPSAKQERFRAKAFDIENQPIRVDLYRKGEWP